MKWDVIIIGGGPAGMAAAAELIGMHVLLLEKKQCLGSKILISGAGQCNLTHEGPLTDYEKSYGDKWRFVRDAIHRFGPEDFVRLLEQNGLETMVLENGKVFPKSLKASDVVDTFRNILQDNGIKVNLNEKVKSIKAGPCWQVVTEKNVYESDHVIVATGGMTYPKTGSEGDAYQFAKNLDMPCVKPKMALAPVYCDRHPLKVLSGLSFKDTTVDHYRNKKIGSYCGDLLITHFGFSGPVILNKARYLESGDILKINFTSYERQEDLEHDFIKACQKNPKKTVRNILQDGFLYNRLVDVLMEIINFDVSVTASELKKQDRKLLLQHMMAFEVEISQVGKVHIAMVTAGGIGLNNIDKKSYAVKKYSGLYFIGECIDVDGDTGGYNIQFAVSSGIAAARAIMTSKMG